MPSTVPAQIVFVSNVLKQEQRYRPDGTIAYVYDISPPDGWSRNDYPLTNIASDRELKGLHRFALERGNLKNKQGGGTHPGDYPTQFWWDFRGVADAEAGDVAGAIIRQDGVAAPQPGERPPQPQGESSAAPSDPAPDMSGEPQMTREEVMQRESALKSAAAVAPILAGAGAKTASVLLIADAFLLWLKGQPQPEPEAEPEAEAAPEKPKRGRPRKAKVEAADVDLENLSRRYVPSEPDDQPTADMDEDETGAEPPVDLYE